MKYNYTQFKDFDDFCNKTNMSPLDGVIFLTKELAVKELKK